MFELLRVPGGESERACLRVCGEDVTEQNRAPFGSAV